MISTLPMLSLWVSSPETMYEKISNSRWGWVLLGRGQVAKLGIYTAQGLRKSCTRLQRYVSCEPSAAARAKPTHGYSVLIDDSQRSKAGIGWIVVIGERERMEGLA